MKVVYLNEFVYFRYGSLGDKEQSCILYPNLVSGIQ
jgi:hypothetical protein